MSIKWLMDKQILVYLCNKLLLINKKECYVDIHNMNESQNNNPEQKKLYKIKSTYCMILFI